MGMEAQQVCHCQAAQVVVAARRATGPVDAGLAGSDHCRLGDERPGLGDGGQAGAGATAGTALTATKLGSVPSPGGQHDLVTLASYLMS